MNGLGTGRSSHGSGQLWGRPWWSPQCPCAGEILSGRGQAPPLRSSAVPRFSHIQAGAAGALQRKPPPPESRRQNSPGEVPRRGNRDSPFLELPPGCSAGGFPAAGAYAVTPPPHRPVCEKTGERRWNVGAGLVPARRGFPQRRGIEATTRAAPTVAQNRERICRYPVRSSGRRVVISLPPVYTTVSERFFLTFHPVEGVW